VSTLHELKTDAKSFHNIWHSRKTFELRPDDRGFKIGDVLHLKELRAPEQIAKFELRDQEIFTGRTLLALVVYVLRDAPEYGLASGYAAMSLKLLTRLENESPCGMEGAGS
jgi:hypothetical protein